MTEHDGDQLDRRSFLNTATKCGVLAWTVPAVLTFDASPAAATPPPPGPPPPEMLLSEATTVEEGSGNSLTISGKEFSPNQSYEIRWRQPDGFEYVAFESLTADNNGVIALATLNVYADARTSQSSTAYVHAYDRFGTCVATRGVLLSAAGPLPPGALDILTRITTVDRGDVPVRRGTARWGMLHEVNPQTVGHEPEGWSPEKLAKIRDIVGSPQPTGWPRQVMDPAKGPATQYRKGDLVVEIDHLRSYPTPGVAGNRTPIPDGEARGFVHGPWKIRG